MVQINIEIGPASILYQRVSYSLINVAKDVGGVANVLLLTFSLVVYPFSNFSFFLRAINKLYFARTKDSKLFKSLNEKDNKRINLFFEQYSDGSTYVKKKKKHLKVIKLSNYDAICLFFS